MDLSDGQIEDLFPCYILTDGDLVVEEVGRSVARFLPGPARGERLDSLFTIERPIAALDPAVAARDKTTIQLRSRDERLQLSGTVVAMTDGYLFCLSHSARTAAIWGDLGLTADDFSQADQSLAIGAAIGIQATLMAELSDMVASLRLARDEALAANAAKSTFLSVMSHEIRTPLNGILGMTQAMIRDADDDQLRSRLDIVQKSGESLLAILNDVLDLSRIEAGRLTLEAIPFDLADVLSGAHAAFTALANKKGLSFNLDVDPAAGRFLGDPTRVRQIAYNLLSNALKFTEAGSVVITARGLEDGLEITVSDTGVGIAPDKLSEIFSEFSQADASISRRYGGTGLGLAIARNLAALMNGSITVVSLPDVGSTFTVRLRLPRAEANPQDLSADDVTPEPLQVAGELRVLAAEDNQINQLVLRTLLEQIGVTPTVVDNGAEAVEAWGREPWDLILMDIQMPVMGGVEATRRIREQEALTGRPPTPIIALTANTMTHQLMEYETAGITGIVSKPIQAAALLEALFNALEPQDLAAQ